MNKKRRIKWAVMVSLVVFILASAYLLYYEFRDSNLFTKTVDADEVGLHGVGTLDNGESQEGSGDPSDGLTPVDVDLITEGTDEEFQGYVPILMYHSFQEGETSGAIVNPSEFREQLTYLKEQGYTTINEYDLLEAIEGKKSLPAKPLLITIDDGYRDNYEFAFPILKELDMKATIYVITKHRGQKPGSNQHFSWEEAKEMVDSGHITIQSHTHDHHYKVETQDGKKSILVARQLKEDGSVETDAEYRERLTNDLKTSKELIEQHIEQPVISFAYPFGVYDEEVIEIASELGYKLLLTVENGVFTLEDSVYTMPRVNVPGGSTGADIEADILLYAEMLVQ